MMVGASGKFERPDGIPTVASSKATTTFKQQFFDLVKNTLELDINKVVLFTKKEKVTLPFKAVSAALMDKLRFYIVYIPEKNPPADLLSLSETYNSTELPKLLIE